MVSSLDLSEILGGKIKQKELVNKCNVSNLVKNSDLNTNLAALATKAELKEEKDKVVKQQTHDLNYFLGKIFFGDDGSQNMFVYHPTLETLQLKKDKVKSKKSQRLYILLKVRP